ncbi:MAG TPA: TIGR03936 family radical SAM-associated protein [Lachnospiraceae bacterium]|nr:TIGR03936 family radical SAM-associated protein [Lachnospiraceae bacterium]
MKIRIKFSKHGAIRYIGHLDMMRYFQKLMRRAEIDIKYSTGMSPHQIMSFAMPLGVGVESDGEYLDIEVEHTDSSAHSINRLNSIMSEGIVITEYKQLPDDAKNAMASVAAADYEVKIREEYMSEFDVRKTLSDFAAQKEILIIKKTKKSEKEIDLKPYIYQMHLLETPNQSDVCPTIFMQLSAGSEVNIKPNLVMEALYTFAGSSLPEYALHVTRKELYASEHEKLVTLGSIGSDI